MLSFSFVHSQEFRLGAKAGVNISSFGGKYTDGLDARAGFHLGGLVEIPLVGNFSIQSEILYSSQGTNFNTYFGIGESYDSRLSLDYINIPIMAKYYIIRGLTAELGPQIGFLVSAKSKYDNVYGKNENDVKENYKSIDFSQGIGASYRLNNGVFFSLRFNKGISNINESSVIYYDVEGQPLEKYSGNDKQHNNVLQISAGYLF